MKWFRTFCGVSLFGLLLSTAALTTAPEAHARKLIILTYRAIQPVGQLNSAGTVIKLSPVTTLDQAQLGERILYRITVVQPGTGAQGIGTGQITAGQPFVPDSLVRLTPGSPRFQPGVVEARAEATYVRHNRVVRTWSWTQPVVLRR